MKKEDAKSLRLIFYLKQTISLFIKKVYLYPNQ